MKLQGLLLASALGALTVLTSGRGLTSAADTLKMGSEVAYTFRNTPVNGVGLKSLASLRGKPVLVEFWGTR